MLLRGCPCCTASKIDKSTNRQMDRRKCLLDKRNYQKRDFKSLVRPCKGADRSGTRAVGSPFRYRHMQAHPRTGTRICASSKKVSVNLSGEGGGVGGRPEFALASTVWAASTWRVAQPDDHSWTTTSTVSLVPENMGRVGRHKPAFLPFIRHGGTFGSKLYTSRSLREGKGPRTPAVAVVAQRPFQWRDGES